MSKNRKTCGEWPDRNLLAFRLTRSSLRGGSEGTELGGVEVLMNRFKLDYGHEIGNELRLLSSDLRIFPRAQRSGARARARNRNTVKPNSARYRQETIPIPRLAYRSAHRVIGFTESSLPPRFREFSVFLFRGSRWSLF